MKTVTPGEPPQHPQITQALEIKYFIIKTDYVKHKPTYPSLGLMKLYFANIHNKPQAQGEIPYRVP